MVDLSDIDANVATVRIHERQHPRVPPHAIDGILGVLTV
jgi:hypothetical protein